MATSKNIVCIVVGFDTPFHSTSFVRVARNTSWFWCNQANLLKTYLNKTWSTVVLLAKPHPKSEFHRKTWLESCPLQTRSWSAVVLGLSWKKSWNKYWHLYQSELTLYLFGCLSTSEAGPVSASWGEKIRASPQGAVLMYKWNRIPSWKKGQF